MDFSVKSALSFGWETFKRRPWFFIGSALVILVAGSVAHALTQRIDHTLTGSSDTPSAIGAAMDWALGTLISMGAAAFFLAAQDDVERVSLGALWHPSPFWKYLLATLLMSIAVGLGLLLLIVPGIIFALMFAFAPLIVIDRGLDPIEALKESKRITEGHRWQLLGLALLSTLIVLLGLLAAVVGVLVSIPVVSLAFAHAYRTLAGRAAADIAMPSG